MVAPRAATERLRCAQRSGKKGGCRFERQLQRRNKWSMREALTAFLKTKFGPADPQIYYIEKLIKCRQGLREDVDMSSCPNGCLEQTK